MQASPQQQLRRKSFSARESLEEIHKVVLYAFNSGFDGAVKKYPILDQSLRTFETAVGLSRKHVLAGIALFPLALFAMIYFTPFILGLSTVVYPIMMSVKSIEKGQSDRTKWLMYWVIFNTLVTIESLFGVILFIIPFYPLLKNVYLTWCMMPWDNNGSNFSYNMFRPLFLKAVLTIEMYFEDTANKFQTILDDNKNSTELVTNGIKATVEANGIGANGNLPDSNGAKNMN